MKIYLEEYGCTANKSDGDLIRGTILESNHEIVTNIDDADVLVILTCTVIDTTQQRMLSRLKFFEKTGKKIVVAGCMASIQEELVYKKVPNALLLPPEYSHQIVDLLDGKKIDPKNDKKNIFPKKHNGLVAPLLISEGCMFSCSYCITSKARGKLRSFSMNEIKTDVLSALEQGCKEIQITAQDTASYGLDKRDKLGDLLKNVSEIPGEFRIRVGMMNPFTLTQNINNIIKGFDSPKIYKFLHIPVQSGDDDVLGLMNRKYNVDDFLEIVSKFRKKYPNITLATDIIVGFPSETDKQFKNTIDLLNRIKPDVTNITRFSARPFTDAKKMKGRIKTEIVKNRSRRMSGVCSQISYEKNKENVGKKYRILVTEKGKNNTYVGRSENYKPVVTKEKVKIGCFYNVEIIDSGPTYLIASLI